MDREWMRRNDPTLLRNAIVLAFDQFQNEGREVGAEHLTDTAQSVRATIRPTIVNYWARIADFPEHCFDWPEHVISRGWIKWRKKTHPARVQCRKEWCLPPCIDRERSRRGKDDEFDGEASLFDDTGI